MPNNIPRNPPLCSFALFYINKPDFWRDLIISIVSYISSFEIINVVIPDPKTYFWIAASVADAAVVNPNCIKTLLANGLSTFFIKGKPFLVMVLKSLPKTPPDCPILDSWVFNNFVLADQLFAKALWRLKSCVVVNNNLCGNLVSLF